MGVKVSICIITYNQEEYIERCLSSIVDQKTDFKYEVIVGDDFSTDNTRTIVARYAREYPNLIVPVLHPTNVGGCNNYISVHNKAKGQYICHVDGDDYMLPGKIQTCADLLDSRPDVGIVFHRMEMNFGSSVISDLIDTQVMKKCDFDQKDVLALGSIACHSSRMYRSELRLSEYPEQFLDYYIDVMQLHNCKAHIINEILGGYTVGIGQASSGQTKKTYIGHLQYFFQELPEMRGYIGSNFLTLLAISVKNRVNIGFNLKYVLNRKMPISAFLFMKYLRFRRYMRIPKVK